MKRPAILLPLLLCLAPAATAARAQDWAKAALDKSSRHGEFVTIKEPGGRALEAWVVYPEVKDKAPVVVMIHEIYGLSDWAREMADELAGAGYIVIAPDLLSGLGPAAPAAQPAAPPANPMANMPNMDHAHMDMPMQGGQPFVPMTPGGTHAFPDQGSTIRAVSALPDPQVLTDLDAAADYGRKLPAANGQVYVAGFCWGGSKSFLFATHRKDLSAAFVFYGTAPANTDLLKNITAPVYGFYAGNDAHVDATIPSTADAMQADGKKYEPKIYDGAGHGFMRAGEAPDASAANTAARQEAFHRLVDLLGGLR